MASAKLPGQTKTQLALPWFMTVPIKRFFSAEKFRILSLAGTLSIVTMTSHLGCDVIIKIAARLKHGGVREDPTAVFTEFLTSLALESTAASFRICRTERTGNGRLKRCSDLVAAGWGVHYLERLLARPAPCYSLRKWFTYFSMPSFFQNMPFQTKNKVRLFFVLMGGASFAFSLPFIMTWFQIKKKSS